MADFELRAVISEADHGYVVSVSKLADDGEITILGEEEVESLAAAHNYIGGLATECSCAAADVSKLYNIGGDITTEPPPGVA